MKRIILISAFAILSLMVNAQQKSSSNSKWKETKNGVTYQMEVSMDDVTTKTNKKPHLSFSIKGETSRLNKVVFTQKNDLFITLPVSKETQDINVESGLYTLKIYHDKLGEPTFDVDLKRGDDKIIILTLK